MESVEREIFNCPRNRGNNCPVALKFKENNRGKPKGDVPIPEAYLGNPRSEFVILGINPGGCENELPPIFEEYQECIRQPLNSKYWQYHYAAEIFGYSLRDGEGIVTNLIHCPTPSWSVQKNEKWQLDETEKQKSLNLCSPFCSEIIDDADPKLILLHGLYTIKFFSRQCLQWGISEDAENKDIHGLVREYNGRTFVLSKHLRSLCVKRGQGAWKNLIDAKKKLEKL